jgi:NAD+ kinase
VKIYQPYAQRGEGSKLNNRYNYTMPTPSVIPRRIAIATHPTMPAAVPPATAIAEYLQGKGVTAVHDLLDNALLRKRVKKGDFDLFIAVGGDGTVLRSAHLCAPVGIPILGVNMGRLGFLIQVGRDEWKTACDDLLKGEFWVENRMMIRAQALGRIAGKLALAQ